MARLAAVGIGQIAISGSTMTLEELEPTFPGGKLRKLVLVGGGLPIKGQAKWTGQTNVKTTWFVGNGLEGSQQVLVPTLMPSQFGGEWNRTRLGRAPCIFFDEAGARQSVNDPKVLWDVFEDLRRAAPRLRVTWAVRGQRIPGSVGRKGTITAAPSPVDFSVVREGRLTVVDVTPMTDVDLLWNATFEWVSAGGTLNRVASVRTDDDVGQISQGLQDSVDALDDFVNQAAIVASSTTPLSASKLTLGRLEAMAKAPLKAVNSALSKLRYDANQFKQAAQVARLLETTPLAIQASVLDFSRDVVLIAQQVAQTFATTPVELQANKRRVADLVRAHRYFGRILDQTALTARQAAEVRARLARAQVSGGNRGRVTVRDNATGRATSIIAIHVTRDGDTPTRLSVRFYGNPDQADVILKANRLPLHTPSFKTGTTLVIPDPADTTVSKTATSA